MSNLKPLLEKLKGLALWVGRKVGTFLYLKFTLQPVSYDANWVRDQVSKVLSDKVRWIQLDNRYWTCSKAEFEQLVKWDWLETQKYVSDRFDCDDFAMQFKARIGFFFNLNNVGVVVDYSSSHAYNVVLFSDAPMRIFEPQSGEWFEFGTSRLYQLEDGLILL